MRQPNRLVKTAVLASSILLVGAFVAYRAKAFNPHGEADPRGDHSGANRGVSAGTGLRPVDSRPLPDFDFNPFNPPRSALEEAAAQRPPINGFIPDGLADEPDETYMSGSKSDRVFLPQWSAKDDDRAIIMSSSKSFILAPPPSQAAASGPARGVSQSSTRSR
jgi:hypothetical protein